MKMYGFYSNIDPKKEIIDRKPFSNYLEAVKHFSLIKNLNIDKFLELYSIIQTK